MEKDPIKVLIIEDDPNYFVLINERLVQQRKPSFEVVRSKILQSGIDRLKQGDIDVILLDLFLPDSKGLDSFITLHAQYPEIPTIILTSLDDDNVAAEAIAKGAQDYLVKGSFDRELFIKSICYAISRHQVQSQLKRSSQENEESKKTIKEREERFRSLVSNIPGAVYRYVKNENGSWEIEFISSMIKDISGWTAADLIGKGVSAFFEKVLPQDLDVVQKAFSQAAAEGGSFSVDYRIRHADGDFRWAHEQGRGIKDSAGRVCYVDGVIFDVTERTREKEKLNRLVYYDSLTNLPNKELFIDRLDQVVAHARRKNEIGAVLFLDLDHFKRINDTLGHAVGDQLIKAVSIRLAKTVYESDTVTRIGGASFMVLLPRIEKPEYAENAANKIITAFKTPFIINDHELFTSCSIGMAIFPNDGAESETLLKNADAAMHMAKERGRNRYQLFSSAIANNSFERLVLENSLRHALERNEFQLHYQPQLDIRSGKITGVEALIRWHHPDLGFIPPMEFIPIAEETGLIHPLGEWVIRTACQQKKIWHQQGLKSLKVAFNLSARQFHYANLLELITNIIKEIDLDPSSLDLELTESTIMSHLEETTETLKKLKDMGMNISIDDFGTGYSSLMYLKSFPIDTIKIDKSFVRDVTTDADDRAITQAIISMAHSLKLDVVAEGVETAPQLAFLQSQDCDKMQGFLYSKPLPPTELAALLNDTNGKSFLAKIHNK